MASGPTILRLAGGARPRWTSTPRTAAPSCRSASPSTTGLEKDPARRPASAQALREALREVPGVAEWSEDDARAWWRRWRSQHTRPPDGSR